MAAAPSKCITNKIGDFIGNFASNFIPTGTVYFTIPITGFALSCFSLGCFIIAIDSSPSEFTLFTYGFLALALSCGIQMRNGIYEKNQKKLLYWLYFKICEMLLLLCASIYCLIYARRKIGGIMSLLPLGISVAQITYVLVRIYPAGQHSSKRAENIYDIPNAEHFSKDQAYSSVSVHNITKTTVI